MRTARVSVALARRALRTTLRRPQLLMPLVLVPTLMLAAQVGGLHRTTTLPGSPRSAASSTSSWRRR